jgi:homoserine O-acetyltransferase
MISMPGFAPLLESEDMLRERIGSVTIPELVLQSGRLEKPVQVYAMYGELNDRADNAIVICHALTGSHRLAGEKIEGQPDPWWDALVGDNKVFDTGKYCVICFNNIASPYGSTSPLSINPKTGKRWNMSFPIVSPRDVAIAQKEALKALGIKKVAAVAGGSLGGMIAAEMAVSFPEDVEKCVLIAAPDRLYPQAIAFNAVQRNSIMSDPDWKCGDYEGRGPSRGLALARMLAMITYRSEQSFSGRYMREMARGSADDWEGQFKVESYLYHHGEELVRRFDANCYLYLTKMMDLHDIGSGRGGLTEAWRLFAGRKLLAVGISSDMLFPSWQVEEAARNARNGGVDARYEEIESENGHDSFLIDFDQLDDFIRPFLSE